MEREGLYSTPCLLIDVDSGIVIPKWAFERASVNMFWKFTFCCCVTVVGDANLPCAIRGAILLVPSGGCWFRLLGLTKFNPSCPDDIFFWLKPWPWWTPVMTGLLCSEHGKISKKRQFCSLLWNKPFLAQASVIWAHPALPRKPWHTAPKQYVRRS